MSQIVDYGDLELEKLALYAEHLRSLLREVALEEKTLDLAAFCLKLLGGSMNALSGKTGTARCVKRQLS